MNLKLLAIIFTIAFSITSCRLLPKEKGHRQGEMRTLSDVQYVQLSTDNATERG